MSLDIDVHSLKMKAMHCNPLANLAHGSLHNAIVS